MQMPPRQNEPDECLTGEVIAGLNRGLLSDEQLDRIGTHLSHCTKCQAALSQWSEPPGNDPFADRLKRCLQLPPVQDTPTLLAIEAAAVAVTRSRSQTGPYLAEAATLAAKATVGPYDLLERVGRGGMGVVHRARHRALGRVVAVKMIRADGASERTVIRFRREAEAIARLDHPNIVRLYDFGEEDGAPYYSMEFVDGGTLSDLLRAGPLDCRAAATIVHTMAKAMAYSHQNEVVHRDLKPANVLRAADNTLKIADFGLAKLLDDPRRLSLTGGIMGTANYMAPEQADGRPDDVGPHTDVYSLGVILFETLTGQTPFRTDDDAETMRRVREETAADPSSLREGIPRDLAAICLKCLEKAPGRRYAHAGLLAADLDLWLRNERPVGIPGPVTRTTRRLWQHRLLVACVAFFVVIATAGAAALYIRDPDKPLREIQASLAADRRVTLIGDTGKPKWFRWLSGEAGGKATTGKDGVFTVHSGDLGLIELLPAVGVESYQFSVEVRHKQSNLPGCVGLYFARDFAGEGPSATQFFTQLSYNDVRGPKDIPVIIGPNGPARRPVQNQVSLHPHALLKNGEREVSWETPGVAGPKFDPVGENKADWRALTVSVSPSRVDATWEGQPIPADMTELMAWAAKEIDRDRPLMPNHPGAQTLRPAFTPSGGVGLYILRGSADFRRATVTLKEPGL